MKACIGLCTFNGEQRLPETLEALGAMRVDPGRVTRLVIVDNASTDGTASLVERTSRLANGLSVHLLTESQAGKTNAMRALFAATDEPIVLTLDDDCLPDEHWAMAMCGVFESMPRAGIVGGPVLNQWRNADGSVGTPSKLARTYARSLGDQVLGEERRVLEGRSDFVMGASLGVRREALEASGWLERVLLESRTGQDLECGAEDAEVCIRVRQAGWEVVYEPGAIMEHVIYAHRQEAAYLAKLRGAVCRGEPSLAWVAGEVGSQEEAQAAARRARRLYFKTLMGTWNARRQIRIAERRGKWEGWQRLADRLAREDPADAAVIARAATGGP